MNKQEALKLLQATSSHVRLNAARFLASEANSSDLEALRIARRKETVSYVKRSLDLAIGRVSNAPLPPPPNVSDEPQEIPPDLRKEIFAKAMSDITGMVLHEIEPRVGQIKEIAKQELANYSESRLKSRLDFLERVILGIRQLRKAASTPVKEEFDLANLINTLIADENPDKAVDIAIQGPQPFLVVGDPKLLALALCNGLRNAIEAVKAVVLEDSNHAVIINWGKTDTEYWVSIIDKGMGFTGSSKGAFEMGNTNKEGHAGLGLAIAKQAVESMKGTVDLSAASGSGAKYLLHWF